MSDAGGGGGGWWGASLRGEMSSTEAALEEGRGVVSGVVGEEGN